MRWIISCKLSFQNESEHDLLVSEFQFIVTILECGHWNGKYDSYFINIF